MITINQRKPKRRKTGEKRKKTKTTTNEKKQLDLHKTYQLKADERERVHSICMVHNTTYALILNRMMGQVKIYTIYTLHWSAIYSFVDLLNFQLVSFNVSMIEAMNMKVNNHGINRFVCPIPVTQILDSYAIWNCIYCSNGLFFFC